MKLTFLGTRGEIEKRTRRHRMHTSLMISHRNADVMIDCGLDRLGKFERLHPSAIVLTHAHPDHAWGLKRGAPFPVYAHICTNIEPRFDWHGGTGYATVTPFKDITQVGTDQEIITSAYKNAPFAAALMSVPSGLTIEAVRPQTAGLAFDMANYNGDIQFVVGGYKICENTTLQYDPLGEKGRHFASIVYAAAPKYPHNLATIVYKRCPNVTDFLYCS